MDWITQAALGAAIGELILGKWLGKWSLAWGALFGVLPELDVLLFPLLSTASQLAWHRGPSHSLLVVGLAAWGLSYGLERLWRREKVTRLRAGCFVAAACATHGLLDALTVEGAGLLWPFLEKRVAFSVLYPVDFLFALPLVFTAIRLVTLREPVVVKAKSRSKKKPSIAAARPSKRLRVCLWGLGLSAGYVLLVSGMKAVAAAGFQADLARRGTSFSRRTESPTVANCVFWRGVIDRGDAFWVGYRSVFERRDAPVRWTIYPKNSEALGGVAELSETRTLTSLTDGWWLARPHAKGAWLGDLRAPEHRVWGSKKGMVDSRLAASWVIILTEKGDPLRTIFPEINDSTESLGRMISRIFGKHEAWEANPRLAGVAGRLPEFLAIEE